MDNLFYERGFDSIMYNLIPFIVIFGFILIFGIIIFTIIQNLIQWKRNNDSPILSVATVIVAKRSDVTQQTHHTGANGLQTHHSSSTRYYVTFEVESGDRLEFEVKNKEYGLLAEKDTGILTFQGTRYLGFDRSRD